MIKVGITGGIGSGKSIVCKVFEQLGISVYSADVEAKKLYDDASVKLKVKKAIGDVFDASGNVDRKKLAGVVFKDKALLDKLNAIIHPAVKEHFKKWLVEHKNEKYILKEAAILFESGTNKGLDYIITVSAPLELRIARTMQRDNISRAEVEKRVASQMSEEEKIKRSDYIIVNDEHELVIPQVLKINRELLKNKK